MFGGLFASIRDSLRHRFGRQAAVEEYRASEAEEAEARGRHDDAEAGMIGRTLGEPTELRAFGKGRPR